MQVGYQDISPIDANYLLILGISVSANQETGCPKSIVLQAALDRAKSNSETFDFPVFIPAANNYHSAEHKKLREALKAGADIVPVYCSNLKIYCKDHNKSYDYYAFAGSFKVLTEEELQC